MLLHYGVHAAEAILDRSPVGLRGGPLVGRLATLSVTCWLIRSAQKGQTSAQTHAMCICRRHDEGMFSATAEGSFSD